MEDIKAVCSEIIESIDDLMHAEINLPDKQKGLIQKVLNDILCIIEEYHKTEKHNLMIGLVFDLAKKVEEYKVNISHDLDAEDLDSNISELETIIDIFDRLL